MGFEETSTLAIPTGWRLFITAEPTVDGGGTAPVPFNGHTVTSFGVTHH